MALCRPFSAAVSCHCMRSVHARHCRDLKPANILFDSPQNPCLKVCDFGLARVARHLEITGFVGTPQYMAPYVMPVVLSALRSDVMLMPAHPHHALTLCSSSAVCRILDREIMSGARIQYSFKVDVFSFGIVLGELLSWCVSYSSGYPRPRGEVEAGGDAAEGGFMALVRLRQSVIDGLRPAEMEASPYRRKRGFAELGTLNRYDSPCSLAHL